MTPYKASGIKQRSGGGRWRLVFYDVVISLCPEPVMISFMSHPATHLRINRDGESAGGGGWGGASRGGGGRAMVGVVAPGAHPGNLNHVTTCSARALLPSGLLPSGLVVGEGARSIALSLHSTVSNAVSLSRSLALSLYLARSAPAASTKRRLQVPTIASET